MISDILPIGEWLPDQQDFMSGGATIALNVLTNGEGYIPFPSFVGQSDDLLSQCYGGYSHISANGTVTTFLATRTKIYKLNGTSWDDVTNTGGDYVTSEEGSWQFTQYGDRVIATNYDDKIQSFLVGTDTEFSDLITSGPDVKCANFGVINNFLVTINVNDSDGQTKNRVRWSPINDPAGDWTASQSTQADFQNVEDGNPGEGMAVIGGQNYGVLVFKNALCRMEYVGPPTFFQITLMENTRGAIHPNVVASNGDLTFFYGEAGFWLNGGVSSGPIGHKKVNKDFSEDIDRNRLHQMRATTSPIDNTFLLTYTSVNSPDGRNDKTLAYSWVDNRFTQIDAGYDFMFRAFTATASLEEIASSYPDLESVPYSFDSRFWAGGETQLAGVFEDALGYFDGTPMTATLEGQEARYYPEGLTYLDSVLPVYQGGSVQVRVGTRSLLKEAVTYEPYQSPSVFTGEVDYGFEARYIRPSIQLSGEWEHFKGFRIRSEAGSDI